jgi:hypothetical protein
MLAVHGGEAGESLPLLFILDPARRFSLFLRRRCKYEPRWNRTDGFRATFLAEPDGLWDLCHCCHNPSRHVNGGVHGSFVPVLQMPLRQLRIANGPETSTGVAIQFPRLDYCSYIRYSRLR